MIKSGLFGVATFGDSMGWQIDNFAHENIYKDLKIGFKTDVHERWEATIINTRLNGCLVSGIL